MEGQKWLFKSGLGMGKLMKRSFCFHIYYVVGIIRMGRTQAHFNP